MNAPVALTAQRTALDALGQVAAAFGHLPAACFSVGDVFPGLLRIDIHDDLGHFEVWRTALGIPAEEVEYVTTSRNVTLRACGSFGGAEVELIGYAPLLPESVPETGGGAA